MLQNREKIHHSQEDEEAEDNEEFHRIAICLLLIIAPLLGASENKGLVGIAECLGEHHHHDGNLDIGTIYAHHRACCLIFPLEEIGDNDLPHILTQDAGNTQDEQWPTIAEHLTQERTAEAIVTTRELRQ